MDVLTSQPSAEVEPTAEAPVATGMHTKFIYDEQDTLVGVETNPAQSTVSLGRAVEEATQEDVPNEDDHNDAEENDETSEDVQEQADDDYRHDGTQERMQMPAHLVKNGLLPKGTIDMAKTSVKL